MFPAIIPDENPLPSRASIVVACRYVYAFLTVGHGKTKTCLEDDDSDADESTFYAISQEAISGWNMNVRHACLVQLDGDLTIGGV